MNTLFIIAIVYMVLFDVITSYRLYADEYYNQIQKTLQYLLIWVLPLVGSFTVAFFLRQDIAPNKKYPWIVRVVAGLFMIKLTKDANGLGYPSSMNEYGGCDGSSSGHYGCSGDGGGCGD